MPDAALIALAVLLVLVAAGVGGGLGVWCVGRRYAPVARPPRPVAETPPATDGPCAHVWTGHPTEQDRNGFRVHKCLKCGDELSVAGR